MDITKLYDPVIKAHDANPYHFERMPMLPYSFKAYNPVCGDRFDFFFEMKENSIAKIYFHGFGCAVSKAASSVLVQSVEGKTINDALVLCEKYLRAIKGEITIDAPKEFASFAAVMNFPSRYDCAAMACEELLNNLKNFVA